MKISYWDILFIVFLAGILLALNALDWLDAVMKFPLVIIFAGYVAGRYVSYLLQKKSPQSE